MNKYQIRLFCNYKINLFFFNWS